MYGRLGPLELLLSFALIVFLTFCWWRIWTKAGFNGAWSLLIFIPFANIGSIIYLAFAKWPIHTRDLGKTFD